MSLADHLYEVREDSSINHKVRIFFIPVVPPFWMMAKIFDPTGKQYRAFERVIDLLYLHIVWIVCLGMFAAVVACAIIMVVYNGQGIYSGLCPAPTPCVMPCIVEADPDIAGVGVRIATYLQAVSGTILLGFSSADLISTRITIAITSVALVSSALVLACRDALSLHHSQVITGLLATTLIPLHQVEPWPMRSPGLLLAHSLRFVAYIAFQYWILLKTPCFGNEPKCNMCIVGWSAVHVTSSALRAFLLFFNGLAFVAWIWVRFNNLGARNLWLTLQALISERRRRQWEEETLQRSEYYWKINMRNGGFFRWYIDDTFASTVFSARCAVSCMSRVWIALRIARCQRPIFSLLFITYQISATETFIKVNLDKRANEWGYGQIMALILTGPSVMTLLRLVVGAVQHNDEYSKSEGPIEFEKVHHEFYYLYYLCWRAVKSPFHPTRGDSGDSFDCVETRRSPPPSTVELRQMSVPEGETADPTDDDDMAPLLSPPPVAAAKAHKVGR